MKKTLLLYPATFVVTALICLLFMMASALVPKGLIEDNARESAVFFRENPLFTKVVGGLENFKIDNYADCISTGIAYHLDSEHPFTSVISADYNRVAGENVGLTQFLGLQSGLHMQGKALSRGKHVLFQNVAVGIGLSVSQQERPLPVDELNSDPGKCLQIFQNLLQPLDRKPRTCMIGHETTASNDNFSFEKAILACRFGLYYKYDRKTIG